MKSPSVISDAPLAGIIIVTFLLAISSEYVPSVVWVIANGLEVLLVGYQTLSLPSLLTVVNFT